MKSTLLLTLLGSSNFTLETSSEEKAVKPDNKGYSYCQEADKSNTQS